MTKKNLSKKEFFAKKSANNLANRKMAWRKAPKDRENWTVIYIATERSGYLERNKHAKVCKLLERAEYRDDSLEVEARHYATGKLYGVAVRVYNEDGSITPAFLRLLSYSSLFSHIADEYSDYLNE